MRVSGGAVIQSLNVKYKLLIEESPATVLSLFLADMKEQLGELSGDILVPFLPEAVPANSKVHIPRRGDKQTLVSLSMRNALNYMREQVRLSETGENETIREQKTKKLLERLREDLRMKELPLHMGV